MRINKKGMSASFLVGTIITLVAFVLIGGTVARFMGGAEDKEAEILCHNSLALRATTALQVGEKEFQFSPVLCKTLDVKISGTKEEILEKVANKISRCWWMFGEGKYEEILDDNLDQLRKMLGFSKEKNDCFLCYTMIIEDKEFKGKIPPQELVDYMLSHNHPQYKGSYIDYIQSAGGPGRLGLIISEIETGKAYGISFLAKNSKKTSWFMEMVGAAGIGAGVVGGYFLCVPTIGAGCVVATAIGLGGSYALGEGLDTKIANAYTERDTSAVYLSSLESAGACFKGDLAGE